MNTLIIGNIIAFAGSVVMVCIGLIKRKKKVLIAQCIQCVLMGTANLVLGGITGFISNVVTILRNLFSFRFAFTRIWKIVFCVIQVGLALLWGIRAGGMGLVDWLPVLAAVIFTCFLDTKSDLVMKYVMILTQAMWLVYDMSIRNYSASAFDVMTLCFNFVALWGLYREKKA